MKNILKNFLIFFLIFAAIMAIFGLFNQNAQNIEKISIAKLVEEINNEEVKSITVKGDELDILLKNESQQSSRKEASESLSEVIKNYAVPAEKIAKVDVTIGEESNSGFLLGSILPFVIPALFIIGLIWFMMRQVQGVNSKAMTFGQSGAKIADQKQKVTFQDVAGAKEAKEDLEEIVDFLKHPQKFVAMGAKIPKGVRICGNVCRCGC